MKRSPTHVTSKSTTHAERAKKIYQLHLTQSAEKTDRMFGVLFMFQWILGVVFALFVSPQTWSGEYSQTHVHVYAAVFLGGLLAGYPIYLILQKPGDKLNRYVIAVSQLLFSTLLIHLTGGRIETHFHVFGSLALLAFYYDWKVLLLATLVTATDHLVRGLFWPQSVYGVLTATPWRALEHAAWVIFEDIFLVMSVQRGLNSTMSLAEKQIDLEESIAGVESQVEMRTAQLLKTQSLVLNQQKMLITSAKMSALGEMAGGVAHEINTPLATIKILSEQVLELLDEGELNETFLRETTESILITSNQIAKIVSGLRAFSRDDKSAPFQKIKMRSLIDETLLLCKERIYQHGIQMRINEFDDQLTINGHGSEISQVLLNLLNNAHDAILGKSEKWIEIEVLDLGDFVEIQVTDSGTSLPQSVQEKLFQPFFTTKEVGQGTGLGLSIALGIVRAHGGQLAISAKCPNTRFTVRLPKAHPQKPHSTAA